MQQCHYATMCGNFFIQLSGNYYAIGENAEIFLRRLLLTVPSASNILQKYLLYEDHNVV